MNYIKRAFRRKKEKGWPKVYIAVDLHDTVITGTYNRMNVGAVPFPGAVEVLKRWTDREDICLILWTPSYLDAADAIRARFLTEHGVRFDLWNENTEVPSGDLCDFSKKWYFDILLEDKAGFEAATDWLKIKQTLIEIGEWD